jgi:hypothetical protein
MHAFSYQKRKSSLRDKKRRGNETQLNDQYIKRAFMKMSDLDDEPGTQGDPTWRILLSGGVHKDGRKLERRLTQSLRELELEIAKWDVPYDPTMTV